MSEALSSSERQPANEDEEEIIIISTNKFHLISLCSDLTRYTNKRNNNGKD